MELILAEVDRCKKSPVHFFNTYIKPPSLPDLTEEQYNSAPQWFVAYRRKPARRIAGDAIAMLILDEKNFSKLPPYMIDRLKIILNGLDAK